MYFFHSNLDFRILPFTISIYTKIARTRQSKNGEDVHHTRIRFLPNACTPGSSAAGAIRVRIGRLLPHGPENIFRDFSEAARHRHAYKSV